MNRISHLLCSLVFCSNFSFGQQKAPKPKVEYRTEIGSANHVTIKQGTVAIGQIIINPSIKSKIYVLQFFQERDTSNQYITKIRVNNLDQTPLFGVNIILRFNKPIISVDATYNGMGQMTNWGYNKEMTTYQYKASQVSSEDGITFNVKSKEKVTLEIYGTDGIKN